MADKVIGRIGGLDDLGNRRRDLRRNVHELVLLRQHLQLLYFIEGKRPHPLQRPNGGLITELLQDLDCELNVSAPPWICPLGMAANLPEVKGRTT